MRNTKKQISEIDKLKGRRTTNLHANGEGSSKNGKNRVSPKNPV